ncbi:MAG TPA: cupin domain-containing protein [Acidobacteria bacterium]|nr:cupin domain-containing protein [Acidobacteriota bacterium]
MGRLTTVSVFALAVLSAASSGAQPAPLAPDPGVAATRLINRAEIRISRVVLQPGAVRSVHAHDDVEYHAWIPLEGTFELSVGTDAPVPALPGQAFFFERGTMHGFRNVGDTEAAVMEVFVKDSGSNASRDVPDPAALLASFAALVGAGTTANTAWDQPERGERP